MALKRWLEFHRGWRRRTICQTKTTHKDVEGQESNTYGGTERFGVTTLGLWEVGDSSEDNLNSRPGGMGLKLGFACL